MFPPSSGVLNLSLIHIYNHNNYNYKHYSDYYYTIRRCTKNVSAVYVGYMPTTHSVECICQEGSNSEMEKRESVWPSPRRKKFSPYEQVVYTVKENNNKEGMRNGNSCTSRLLNDKGTIHFLSTNAMHCLA